MWFIAHWEYKNDSTPPPKKTPTNKETDEQNSLKLIKGREIETSTPPKCLDLKKEKKKKAILSKFTQNSTQLYLAELISSKVFLERHQKSARTISL